MLSTVATLAGFSSPFLLPDGLLPDVARLSLDTGAILIGDAKHSEFARGMATLGRLERYMWWLARLRPTVAPDIFCICHPRLADQDWLGAFDLLSEVTGVLIGHAGIFNLSHDTAVSWVTCFGSAFAARPVGHSAFTPHAPHLGKRALHTARP